MNNLTKRLLALLLTAVMTLSLLPGAALAEEQESSAVEFKTRETSSGLIIRGFQGTFPDGLLEIPSEIGGKKVYCIEKEAFRGTEGLRRVLIPATVNEIGAGAFRDCKDLLNAEFLGEAPKNFGKKVFDGCAKDFAIWHRGGAAETYCVFHGYPYYHKPETLTAVSHSFSGKNGKNSVETVPTNVVITDELFEGAADSFSLDLAKLSLCFTMASSINLKNGGGAADVVKYKGTAYVMAQITVGDTTVTAQGRVDVGVSSGNQGGGTPSSGGGTLPTGGPYTGSN